MKFSGYFYVESLIAKIIPTYVKSAKNPHIIHVCIHVHTDVHVLKCCSYVGSLAGQPLKNIKGLVK